MRSIILESEHAGCSQLLYDSVLLNKTPRTPLHSSIALCKNYDVSRVLIENGADLHNRNVDGKTPLHTFTSPVSEQILCCHGELVDFFACDSRGMSIPHYLAWSSKTSQETFKKYHKRSNFNLSTRDGEQRSMLHFAAQRGNIAIIRYIVSSVGDLVINHADCRGRTALHYGVENKRARDTIMTLISFGADIKAQDHAGRSALDYAEKLRNLAAVETCFQLQGPGGLRMPGQIDMAVGQVSLPHNTQAKPLAVGDKESVLEGRQLLAPGEHRRRRPRSRFLACYDLITEGWKLRTQGLNSCLGLLRSHIICLGAIKIIAITAALGISLLLLRR